MVTSETNSKEVRKCLFGTLKGKVPTKRTSKDKL